MVWRFQILGDLVITRQDEPVDLSSERAAALLRTLLLRANRQVPFRTLLDCVWSSPPADGRNSLHVLIRRLRRALDDPDRIVTGALGYQIRVARDELDAADFLDLLDAAKARASCGDQHGEHEQLTRALRLWPIGATTAPTQDRLMRDLEERRLVALRRQAELDVERGDLGTAIANLRILTCHYPLRERFWAQLMTALRRAGRQAEAMAVYAEARELLTGRLGVEPGTELKAIHAAVLAEENAAEQSADQGDSRPGSPVWTPTNRLPARIADFVGRDAEIAELVGALQPAGGAPVVLLWGLPGAGKSTLAVQVGHELLDQYPDGQWHVMLGDEEPDDLLRTLLLLAGVPAPAIPDGGAARAAAFRERLAGKRVLLLFDGAGSAAQVSHLLPGTPGCAVLLTARNAMVTLPGVTRRRLDPLPLADGVGLVSAIIDRSRAEQQTSTMTELVRLCGGLPLAVRILAARLVARPAMPLQHMVDRLRDERNRLDELAIDGIAVRGSIRLSYDGLTEQLKMALLCTSLLPRAGFAPWALGALAGADGERLCDSLCAAGLLQELHEDVPGQARLRCHDMVALFAAELAANLADDVRAAAVGGLLDALVGYGYTVHRAAGYVDGELPPEPDPESEPVAVPLPGGCAVDRWVQLERATLRRTIELGCQLGRYAQAARVADLTIPTLAAHGDFAPLREMRGAIRDAARAAGDERVACRAELGIAETSISSEIEVTEQTYLACAEVFDRLGAVEELAHSLSGLAFCSALRGSPDLDLATRAATLGKDSPNFTTRCTTARALAVAIERSAPPADALPVLHDALADAQRENQPAARALLCRDIARAALRAGDPEQAGLWCVKAFDLEPPDTVGMGWLLVLHSRVRTAAGHPEDAIASAHQAHQLMARLGNRRGAGSALFRKAEASHAAGRHQESVAAAREAIPLLRATGDEALVRRAQTLLAEALAPSAG